MFFVRSMMLTTAGIVAALSVALVLPHPAHAQSVFVAEYYNERIFKYDASGTNLGLFASLPASGARFIGLAVDSTGRVYTAANGGGGGFQGIRRFAANGTFLGSISMSQDGAIAIGANDVLFAGNYGTGQITRFAADGTSLGLFATAPTNLASLTFDAAGNLFTTSFGATVHKFSATGQDLGVFVSGQSTAIGSAFNNAGELLVVNQGSQTVRRYSATGQDLGVFANAANGLTNPEGVAVSLTGMVYVSNHSSGGTTTVRQFSATGQDLGVFATGASLSSVGSFRPVGVISAAAPEPGSIAFVGAGAFSLLLGRTRLRRWQRSA